MDKKELDAILKWVPSGCYEVSSEVRKIKNRTIPDAIESYARIYGVNNREATLAVGENFRKGEEAYRKHGGM